MDQSAPLRLDTAVKPSPADRKGDTSGSRVEVGRAEVEVRRALLAERHQITTMFAYLLQSKEINASQQPIYTRKGAARAPQSPNGRSKQRVRAPSAGPKSKESSKNNMNGTGMQWLWPWAG